MFCLLSVADCWDCTPRGHDAINEIHKPPNETVEKRILESTFSGQPLVERPDSPSEGGLTDVSPRHGSAECPKRVDLAEIMYQGEQSPLYIHFQFGPEREAEGNPPLK
jgi:hypothetical protein